MSVRPCSTVSHPFVCRSIPPLEIVTGDGGAPEITVNDDPFSHTPLPGVSRLPLAVTLCKVAVQNAGEWIIDATSDEEQCSSVRLTLSLSPDGRLCGVSKGGVGTLHLAALDAIMAHAAPLGVQLNKIIQEEVNRAKGDAEEGEALSKQQPAPAPVPVSNGADAAATSGKSASKKKKQPKQQAMED